MCLLIKGSRKKAIEDIPCYKVLRKYNKMLVSPFQFFVTQDYNVVWKVNETKTDTRKGKRNNGQIGEGYFHSYENFVDAMACLNVIPMVPMKIFKAIIPKGTWYYEGYVNGDPGYASKSLRIDKEITLR